MEELVHESADSSLGLVLVPGINSGAKLFDRIEHSLDCSTVRVDAWNGAEDLEQMDLENLHELLNKAYQSLEDEECEFIGFIGKSFGGQLALTSGIEPDFMVLWAPAIGFGEHNVEKWRSTLLKHAQTATDISVDQTFLEMIDSKVRIIHGTEDNVVDIENSRKICEALPECEFSEIEDANHSFTGLEEKLVEETIEFIYEEISQYQLQ